MTTAGQAVGVFVERAKALVCDFDGTLVDSNRIKWRAFEVCFSEFPERLEAILSYCRGHHQTPRWEKFRHVYEVILGRPYTLDVARRLNERFEAETTRQIVVVAEIPGAERFLRAARASHLLAVVSSTPHPILLRILTQRGWRGLFDEMRGAPVTKGEWFRTFREVRGFGEADVVVFGDTAEDARAASAGGCTFVGVGDGPFGVDCARLRDFTVLCPEEPRVALAPLRVP